MQVCKSTSSDLKIKLYTILIAKLVQRQKKHFKKNNIFSLLSVLLGALLSVLLSALLSALLIALLRALAFQTIDHSLFPGMATFNLQQAIDSC